MARKGMAKGTGKGYKNITGMDSGVHSMSAKGMKQPQRVNPALTTPKNAEKYQRLDDTGIYVSQDFWNKNKEYIKDEAKKNQIDIMWFKGDIGTNFVLLKFKTKKHAESMKQLLKR